MTTTTTKTKFTDEEKKSKLFPLKQFVLSFSYRLGRNRRPRLSWPRQGVHYPRAAPLGTRGYARSLYALTATRGHSRHSRPRTDPLATHGHARTAAAAATAVIRLWLIYFLFSENVVFFVVFIEKIE